MKITFLAADGCLSSGITGLLDMFAIANMWSAYATTNWQFARKFKRRFPEVHLHPEHLLTEEDGLICTGAATSNFNLGLRIIGRYGSNELASACAKALLLDPNRESQTPYFMFRQEREHSDGEVLKAQRYLEENFSKSIKIDEVADHVHISSRHFKRRFKHATGHAPVHYLQMVRIEAAKKKLETTLETIEEITQYIGYEDIYMNEIDKVSFVIILNNSVISG